MQFQSTRGSAPASLDQALANGLAADGGLYVPVELPQFDDDDFAAADSVFDVAAVLLTPFFQGSTLRAELPDILAETFSFPVPLTPLPGSRGNAEILELYHGPTAAFKDVGARFLAACLSRLEGDAAAPLTILVATSGDTGGAVAAAFDQRVGMRVVVLFPDGRVSERQAQQLTCWSDNVLSVAVKGSFDDCQDLVKAAFRSSGAARLGLTAANSINVGRLVPQTFYYLDAVRQGGWGDCAFSVPSGNLGNLTAGLLAALAGLRVRRFVSALNANDTFLRHLETGSAETRPAVRTLSSAMDVSLPNNLERLVALTGGDRQRLRRWVWSVSFSDSTTSECMARVYSERGYLLDPHGAVGMLGAEAYRREEDDRGPMVVLATAHPAKLRRVVEAAVGEAPAPPPEIAAALVREEKIVPLELSEAAFLDLLEEVADGRVMSR